MLADGAAVIDADDQVVVGRAVVNESGVSVVPTFAGDFQLLPRSLLITPIGEVLDLRRSAPSWRPNRRRRAAEPTAPHHDDRRMTVHRHPIDTLSAALGVVTVGAGILVMTDAFDRIDTTAAGGSPSARSSSASA